MSPHLEAELRRSHPLLYAEPYLECDRFMRCGAGWVDIIERLSNKLEALIFAEREQSRYRALQVKEKFGRLRFYMTTQTAEMLDAIAAAEAESERTCEHCGEPGKLRSLGWVRTLCDRCNDVTEKEKAARKP